MPKISIIVIGKTKNKAYLELESEYLSRLVHYTGAEIITLKDSASKVAAQKIKEESEAIEKIIQPGDKLIVLDERGKSITSVQLAQTIQTDDNQGIKRHVYIIGGAFGLSESIKKKAHLLLGLSALTLPHELARVTLLEQLYRAYTIIRGEKYHH